MGLVARPVAACQAFECLAHDSLAWFALLTAMTALALVSSVAPVVSVALVDAVACLCSQGFALLPARSFEHQRALPNASEFFLAWFQALCIW